MWRAMANALWMELKSIGLRSLNTVFRELRPIASSMAFSEPQMFGKASMVSGKPSMESPHILRVVDQPQRIVWGRACISNLFTVPFTSEPLTVPPALEDHGQPAQGP